MLINTLANKMRTDRGEPLTLEMVKAELNECLSLKPKNTRAKMDLLNHISALRSWIKAKENTTN